MITDSDLRVNYDFVLAYESLRRAFGFREMSDAALRDISTATGVPYETIRIWRHLRNALAHGDRVNNTQLVDQLAALNATLAPEAAASTPTAAAPAVSRERSTVPSSRPSQRAFRIHAWKDQRLEQEMIANGFISLGGEEIGDLTDVFDREIIRTTLARTMPDRAPRAIGLFVGYWARFLWEADQGDLIVLPLRDKSVAIGEFTGPYHYVTAPDERARHRRSVAWTAFAAREAFSTDLLKVLNSQHSVQEFTIPGAVAALHDIIGAT